MGIGLSCCAVREEDGVQPKLRARARTFNYVLDEQGSPLPRLTPRESLDEEWAIVGRSIDAEELVRLRQLGAAVQDLDYHPACAERPLNRQAQTLLRFLRGRDGDVAAATKMFCESLDWRDQFAVDAKIAAWRRELEEGVSKRSRLILAYGTDTNICLDKYGLPVWLMRLSVSDPAGILREVGQDILLVNSLSRMEAMHDHLRRAMFRNGRLVRGCVQVIDIGDYGEHGVPNWSQRMWESYRVGKPVFKFFDRNYPETTRTVFIVRNGFVTMSIYRLVKPLVPYRTQKKMQLFGASASEWVDKLQAELQVGQKLPSFLASDSAEAFACARPAGGLVPDGGEVDEVLQNALRPNVSTMEFHRCSKTAERAVHDRPCLPSLATILLLVVVAAVLSQCFAVHVHSRG